MSVRATPKRLVSAHDKCGSTVCCAHRSVLGDRELWLRSDGWTNDDNADTDGHSGRFDLEHDGFDPPDDVRRCADDNGRSTQHGGAHDEPGT